MGLRRGCVGLADDDPSNMHCPHSKHPARGVVLHACGLLTNNYFSTTTDALSANSQWVTVDAQQQGELWIRVGLDGVPLWKSHVVACTICPCSKLKTLPMHSPQWHFVFCLLRGTDSVGVVKDMLARCKIIEGVGKLNTRRVTIDGKQYVVRVFLCGEHMLMFQIAGRDPPSCTRRERRPCPYCDSTPGVFLAAASCGWVG